VAGLRAIAAHAPASQGARWSKLADAVLTDVSGDCLHPAGRWQRAPGDERIDAALLLPPIRGALAAEDPLTLATLDAALAELGREGNMYRFRPDERPPGTSRGRVPALRLHHRPGPAPAGP
jgi:GH15 family glucan-1,4-alpha-glucosidase